MEKHIKNRNNVDFEVLYAEALELLGETGEISTAQIQQKLTVGYAVAREIFDRMVDNKIILQKSGKGVRID